MMNDKGYQKKSFYLMRSRESDGNNEANTASDEGNIWDSSEESFKKEKNKIKKRKQTKGQKNSTHKDPPNTAANELDLKRLDEKYFELREMLIKSSLKKPPSSNMMAMLKMVFEINIKREQLYYQRLYQLNKRRLVMCEGGVCLCLRRRFSKLL